MLFINDLLNWYNDNKRDLPWRSTSDPYKIWLSEIMLQQTKVDTVIPYYLNFIKEYPSFKTLSKSDEQHILNLWQVLGYYSRARRLIPCAKKIMNEFHGEFPKTYSEAITLPGVGPYTAGAVLSIAYNQKIPAIDGNVKRVYSRLYNLFWDMSAYSSKKKLKTLVEKNLPENCRDFNQALMELGALLCTPTSPRCTICPVKNHCLSKKKGTQLKLPIKKKRPKKAIDHITIIMLNYHDTLFIEKRPSKGLLADMWGFISIKDLPPTKASIEHFIAQNYRLKILSIEKTTKTRHIFTHKIWNMTVFSVTVAEMKKLTSGKWVPKENLNHYPIPKAFSKLL